MAQHIYRPLYRPMSGHALPAGVTWDYVERPASFVINRPELPQSRYPYGLIALSRRLTVEEADRWELVWVDELTL